MNLTKKFMLGLILCWVCVPLSHADDWDLIDTQVKQPSLCHAFEDGKTYVYERTSETSLGRDQWMYEIKVFCQGAEARLEYWKNNQKFSEDKFKEDTWNQMKGNLLRYKAQFAAQMGQSLTLNSVEKSGDDLYVTYSIGRGASVSETGKWIIGSGSTLQQIRFRLSIRTAILKETTTDELK